MNYKKTTQVPNLLLDTYMPRLKPSEVLILLIIIRQTLGWYDLKTKKRKERDWISYRQFKKKTGLSIKTISKSINHLITLKLISATNKSGVELYSPNERKGKACIYYQCLFVDRKKSTRTYVTKGMKPRSNLPITKLTTKLKREKIKKETVTKIPDYERINEILKISKEL